MIIGWSQIARRPLLDAPRLGVIGVHPTLLPVGRGRAAIPWAILKGITHTGVTMFRLDEGVDTGDIIAQEILPIAPTETATTLYERVRVAHEVLIANVWPNLMAGKVSLTPQRAEDASEWPARTPEDGRFTSQNDCLSADYLVRATTHPYPGAFFDDEDTRWRIWAGRAVKGARPPEAPRIENASLHLPLADGVFIATEWNREHLPKSSVRPSIQQSVQPA
jgi:methionyl-tRNA formyltransferase